MASSRVEFLAQRRQQVESGRLPEPNLEDVKVTTVGADRRVVTFVQRFGEGGADAFLDQRRQQVETGRAPEPKLEDVTVATTGADRRVVTFVQRFGNGAVRKELTLVREGGLWLIVAERPLEVL